MTGVDYGSEGLLDACLSLIHILGCDKTQEALPSLCRLFPALADSLIRSVPTQPKVLYDGSAKRFFLASEIAKAASAFRSPFSKKWFRPGEDEIQTKAEGQGGSKERGRGSWIEDVNVKSLEEKHKLFSVQRTSANDALEDRLNEFLSAYTAHRFPTAMTSAYYWPYDEKDSAGLIAVFVRNAFALSERPQTDSTTDELVWSSAHFLNVTRHGAHATLAIKSTVFLHLECEDEILGSVKLTGRTTQLRPRTRVALGASAKADESGPDRALAAAVINLVASVERDINEAFRFVGSPRARQALSALRIDDKYYAEAHLKKNRSLSEKLLN